MGLASRWSADAAQGGLGTDSLEYGGGGLVTVGLATALGSSRVLAQYGDRALTPAEVRRARQHARHNLAAGLPLAAAGIGLVLAPIPDTHPGTRRTGRLVGATVTGVGLALTERSLAGFRLLRRRGHAAGRVGARVSRTAEGTVTLGLSGTFR